MVTPESAVARFFIVDHIDEAWFAPAFIEAVPPATISEITAGMKKDLGAFREVRRAGPAFVAAFEDFQMSEGELHAKDDHLADVAVSALAEGRAQFAIGTPEREVIDSIPINGSQPEPNQAVISVATSPGVGEAHLEFDASHATSFDVLHKGPFDAEFAIVADDTVENFYDATGLDPGQHEYQVIGENSSGTGPASDIATIEIGVP